MMHRSEAVNPGEMGKAPLDDRKAGMKYSDFR